jgi:hypothetical protein
MEMDENSNAKHKCDICSKEITVLTKKLQEHSTAGLWVRHGQCCAACVAPEDITGMYDNGTLKSENQVEHLHANIQDHDPHTNILSGLERAVELEELRAQKTNRCAGRTVTAGRAIVASSLLAGFLFFYYEYFIIALICLTVCIGGLIVCRLGILKQCRTRPY